MFRHWAFCCVFLGYLGGAVAQDLSPASGSTLGPASAGPLPDALSLPQALRLLDPSDPVLMAADARVKASEAKALVNDAVDAWRLDLSAQARVIEPSELASDQRAGDGRLQLSARRLLYDFGGRVARDKQAKNALEAARLAREEALNRRVYAVLEAYFAVLEADLKQTVTREDMATAFVGLDRARDQRELGTLSDVDLFALEAAYQRRLLDNVRAEQAQRAARQALASALNRPDQLPSDVFEPELAVERRQLPDFDALWQRVLQRNKALASLAASAKAAQASLDVARSGAKPKVSVALDGFAYQRDLSGRDRWQAGLVLSVPLFDGGAADADAAAAVAQQLDVEAQRQAERQGLRAQLLAAWQAVEQAQTAIAAARAELDFRELYLDRSRADYELEFKTDLGDAMGRWSAANLAMAKARHALALAWAKLDWLTGDSMVEGLFAPASVPLATDSEAR